MRVRYASQTCARVPAASIGVVLDLGHLYITKGRQVPWDAS